MSLIRPLNPSFWRKNTVPSRPVRLIPGHPLGTAGGLIACYVPGTQGFRDLCGNFPLLLPWSTFAFGNGPAGPGSLSTASSSGLQSAAVTSLAGMTLYASIFWFGDVLGIPSSTTEIFGLSRDINDHFISVTYSSGVLLFIATNSAGTQTPYNAGSGPFAVNSQQSFMTTVALGGNITAYKNGAVLGTATAPTGTFGGPQPTSALAMGAWDSGSGYNNTRSYLGLLYKSNVGNFSAQLAAEPFCMLEEIGAPISYSFPAVVPPAGQSGIMRGIMGGIMRGIVTR